MITDPHADPLSPALRRRVDAAAEAVVEFVNGAPLRCPPTARREPQRKRGTKAPKITPRSPPNWARDPLSDSELAIIAGYRWPTFGAELTITIAEGWNAGNYTADMAARIGAKPGSLRILIGKLTQIGVSMRRVAPPRPGPLSRRRRPLRLSLKRRRSVAFLGSEHDRPDPPPARLPRRHRQL